MTYPVVDRRARRRGAMYGGGFLPRHLFRNGEEGVWYDPSDLNTLFQDAAGTTPVTADGDPVGLVLDKSKGLALGPELVTNGGFDTAAGWILPASGWEITQGAAVANLPSGNLQQSGVSYDVGKVYVVTYDITEYVSGAIRARISNSGQGVDRSAVGSYTDIIRPTTDDSFINWVSTNFIGTIDNASIRELLGNHATQTVSSARPTYQRGDARGVVNLLKWSEDFGNAVWSKVDATITQNDAVAPDGTVTASKIVLDEAVHARVFQSASIGNTNTHTFSLCLLGTAGETLTIETDVQKLQVVLSDSWARYEVGAAGVPSNIVRIIYRAGDTARTFWAWHPQLEEGSTATPYQRNDSHLGGVATGLSTDLRWLSFDGVDDSFNTSLAVFGTSAITSAGLLRATSDPYLYLYDTAGGSRFLGVMQASGSPATGLSGSPEYYVDGSSIGVSPTRSTLNDAMTVGAAHILTTEDSDMSSWVGLKFGAYSTGLDLNGNLYGLVVVDTDSGKRSQLESYLAKKSGVTL